MKTGQLGETKRLIQAKKQQCTAKSQKSKIKKQVFQFKKFT